MLPVTRTTKELIEIPSPTGYTDRIIEHLEQRLDGWGIRHQRTRKGALIAGNHPSPELVIAGHIDTLGAMVASITEAGIIRLCQLGGWPVTSFEGEYLTLFTHDGRAYRGTFLLDNPATHANREVNSTVRSMDNTWLRLDMETSSRKDLEALGISVGDFVVFDPRFEFVENGFIRSRFLDNKAGTACLLDVAHALSRTLHELPVCFLFSNYEEVGHGAAGGYPDSVKDMLVVDMGVVGKGPAGDEFHTSICAKDSGGPYDFGFRTELVNLARQKKIPHRVDVYPFYSSDGTAALRAGNDFRVALVGPGVAASHGLERTHERALTATCELLTALIESRYSS
ncbi:MAG: M42 family metallopeptidase [Candidatus Cloacimonetes bacterium]|nr:M42 family metallopeptidase [Candidatus Cloacimonadota bacterium]